MMHLGLLGKTTSLYLGNIVLSWLDSPTSRIRFQTDVWILFITYSLSFSITASCIIYVRKQAHGFFICRSDREAWCGKKSRNVAPERPGCAENSFRLFELCVHAFGWMTSWCFLNARGSLARAAFRSDWGKKVEEKDKAPVGLVWKHLHVELIQNIFLLIQLKSTINTLQQMLLNVPKYSWL